MGGQGLDAASVLLGKHDIGLSLLDLAGEDVDLLLPYASVNPISRRARLADSGVGLKDRRLQLRGRKLGEDIALMNGFSGANANLRKTPTNLGCDTKFR